MASIARLAYAILDGTLIRTDRLSGLADRRYYAGKHRSHGVNAQVIADPAGRLRWVSAALPGSTHDLTAAREHAIIDALTQADVMTFADKGYPKRRRFHTYAVQASPPPTAVVPQPEDGQPQLREDPRHRRTRHRHPQDLEPAKQTPLLPTTCPRDPCRNPYVDHCASRETSAAVGVVAPVPASPPPGGRCATRTSRHAASAPDSGSSAYEGTA
jgi:hypothetical protein